MLVDNKMETELTGQENKPFSPQSASYLLGKWGLLAMLAGLIAAAWNGLVVMVVLLGLLLSAAVLAKLWSHFSLAGVQCQRQLSARRVFPGEEIELKLRLVNRKPLPLPWIQVDDEVPLGFVPDIAQAPENRPGFVFLSKAAAVLWYTAVSWQQRLDCHKRGYYQLGPIKTTSGDIFGLYPRSTTETGREHLIVYPRIYTMAQLDIPSLHPLGETRTDRRIFADPTRVIGVRDYNPHDSLRHVHWKATARHQNLQVKVFEPTTTLKIAIFLAVDSFKPGGVFQEDDFELGISAAASIINYVTEQGNAAGMYINTCLADTEQSVRMLPGSGTGQLVTMLEILAKVMPYASGSFEELLENERKNLPWGTTLIIILASTTPALTGLMVNLQENGHKLLVLQVGDSRKSKLDHTIPWHKVRNPRDIINIRGKETS